MSEKESGRMSAWYDLRTIESGGGDIELTCKRCRYLVTITPRHREEPPMICPQCGFDGSDRPA
jgi:hypothetical protein